MKKGMLEIIGSIFLAVIFGSSAVLFAGMIIDAPRVKMSGENHTAVVEICGRKFQYDGEDNFNEALKGFKKNDFERTVHEGTDYFIYISDKPVLFWRAGDKVILVKGGKRPRNRGPEGGNNAAE